MADENILVVGAGASGLMAARELAKAGRRVTILEAKEKTGGRIWDVPAGLEGKSPFMLGAEFIHGDAETTFSLLQEAGITFKQILGKNYNAIDGKLIEFESDRDFWPEMMEKLNDLKDDISLAGFLDRYFGDEKYIAFRESVLRFAEGYDAADANRVSVFSLKKEWEQDEEQHFRIDGGYGRLVNFLEQDCILLGVVILTGKVVSHFNWSRGYVEAITTENERYAGKKAIITLPLGVLQTQDNTLGSVTVSPPLPARMETIREMGFGSVIKVILRFKKPLWPGDAGFIFAKQAFSVWWTQNPDEQPVLTGWLAGPSVKKYQNLHDVDQVELALESLSSMFSRDINELKGNLEEAHSINWGNNPFSRGAYTYICVAEPNAGIILSNPVQDTLYFSGEATFTGAQIGTVEAALVSGKDAAKRVLED